MKRCYKFFAVVLVFSLFSVNSVFALTVKEQGNVLKITKKMSRLANSNKIDELIQYYSKDYKSFDGYNRDEIIQIFKMASELYPKSRTKEKITKVEEKDGLIKVYIEETSKTKMNVLGEDAKYAVQDKVKGKMISYSKYAMNFRNEDGSYRVISDEIFDETTEIKYGEALKSKFEMEVPKNVKLGEEFTVKTTVEMPENRVVVGSIGHDKIIFPPQKYFDPYRTINETGILERVMVANTEGKNEYVNSSYAFIAPVEIQKSKNGSKLKAAISGMGIYVKRMNTTKEEIL